MNDYSKWSLGCLVRELGKAFPAIIDERKDSWYELMRRATDIKGRIGSNFTTGFYRTQWLMVHFMNMISFTKGAGEHPFALELSRRLQADIAERGIQGI